MRHSLKQLLDYYYVLRQGFTAAEQEADTRTLKRCGLYKMATAVMYVMQKVFCLDDKYLIVKADERSADFCSTRLCSRATSASTTSA